MLEAAAFASGEEEAFESAPEEAAVSNELLARASWAVDSADYDLLAVPLMSETPEVEAILVDQIDAESFAIATAADRFWK